MNTDLQKNDLRSNVNDFLASLPKDEKPSIAKISKENGGSIELDGEFHASLLTIVKNVFPHNIHWNGEGEMPDILPPTPANEPMPEGFEAACTIDCQISPERIVTFRLSKSNRASFGGYLNILASQKIAPDKVYTEITVKNKTYYNREEKKKIIYAVASFRNKGPVVRPETVIRPEPVVIIQQSEPVLMIPPQHATSPSSSPGNFWG